MLTLTIAGVLYVASLQHAQSAVREETRLMRMTRQAMMELDRAVLRMMNTPQDPADALAYGQSATKLDSFGSTHLPPTVKRDGADASGAATLAGLRSVWSDVFRTTEARMLDLAREAYEAGGVDRDMAALIAGFAATLDVYELRYGDLQGTIDRTTTFRLAGQLLTGLVSIAAFLLAARRGSREADARSLAMAAADAAREHTLRLFEMTDILQSAADHADANAVLRATATNLLPGFGGALYVFNNSRDRLSLSTFWGMDGDSLDDHIGLQQC